MCNRLAKTKQKQKSDDTPNVKLKQLRTFSNSAVFWRSASAGPSNDNGLVIPYCFAGLEPPAMDGTNRTKEHKTLLGRCGTKLARIGHRGKSLQLTAAPPQNRSF